MGSLFEAMSDGEAGIIQVNMIVWVAGAESIGVEESSIVPYSMERAFDFSVLLFL
jgi:hypothetical protein